MALKGYFGSPGSGKTYEVVENVILPALSKGRRVVTNIAGLKYEAMCDYLEGQGHDRTKLGTIHTIILNDEIAGKFAVIVGDGEAAYLDETRSIIRGGDMVVLDEVWRVWEDGAKLHEDDRKFLRMHRHLSHPETHVTCDVAVIAQNYVDVHRRVRSLIEERYEMAKHLALGSRTRYRVSVFTKGARVAHQRLQKKYKPEIFELYKSHSMGKEPGKEVEVDGRGNVFKGALFAIGIPVSLALGVLGLWGLYRFFNPPAAGPARVATVTAGQPGAPGKAGQTEGKGAYPPPNPVAPPAPEERLSPWRVTGYASNGNEAILFIDVGGRALMQRVADKDTVIVGQFVQLELEGKTLGTFTGINRKRESVLTPTQ